MVAGRAWHIFKPILIATAERLTYRQFLPLVVPVSIHNVAGNIHAWWSMMTAKSISEALMMTLLSFPASSMTLVWRQMRVSASAWLQPSTSMVSCLTTPSSTKKCRHSPRWPTYTWRSCMIMCTSLLFPLIQ